MDDSQKFHEISLTEKDFYNHLNMKSITDFEIKNWEEVMTRMFKAIHYCYLMY